MLSSCDSRRVRGLRRPMSRPLRRASLARSPTRRACIRRRLSQLTGAEIYVKFENFQVTASFKERGALNFLLQLDAKSASPGRRDDVRRQSRPGGRVSCEAARHPGDRRHAGHDALREGTADQIARGRGRAARRNARCGERSGLEARKRRGRIFVHPFDDSDVIAGQGTVALEMLACASVDRYARRAGRRRRARRRNGRGRKVAQAATSRSSACRRRHIRRWLPR